jgi:hypothetical protein
MQFALLLSLSLVLQSGAGLPTLRIVSVVPRTDQTTACAVTLHNIHTRSAVAWVIESVSHHDLGATADNVLAPGLRIDPGKDAVVLFPCQIGERPELELMAVLYDDNTIGGDPKAIASHIIPQRRSLAEGLAELAELLQSARPPRGVDAPSAQLSAFITQSSGSKLTGRAKDEATTIIRRVGANGAVANDFGVLAATVRSEILNAVQSLRVTAQ